MQKAGEETASEEKDKRRGKRDEIMGREVEAGGEIVHGVCVPGERDAT